LFFIEAVREKNYIRPFNTLGIDEYFLPVKSQPVPIHRIMAVKSLQIRLAIKFMVDNTLILTQIKQAKYVSRRMLIRIEGEKVRGIRKNCRSLSSLQ